MAKIRFGIIGTGYRSLCFVRIAKLMPDSFELTGMLFRTEEKARKYQEEYDIPVMTDEDRLLETNPDFIVVATNWENIPDVTIHLLKRHIAVLAETPIAPTLEKLMEIWEVREKYQGKLQVAEQYFRYPTHDAKIKMLNRGIIGDLSAITISMAHNYHGISLLRKYMNIGMENAIIYGRQHVYPVTATDSRYGMLTNGDITNQERLRLTMEFESGKLAFYDFSTVQYRTFIRAKHLNVQGVRGELDDNTLVHLSNENYPVKSEFHVCKYVEGGGIHKIYYEGEELFSNPFSCNCLTEDEFAVTMTLAKMKQYLQEGKEGYPLKDAFQDMYLAHIFDYIARTGETVQTKKQIWSET